MLPLSKRLCRSPNVLCAILLLAGNALAAPDPDDPEGVGDDMGYRMFGEMKKNKPLLLQNSRPHPVQVFDETKGVYISIPPFSDREFSCKGKLRALHVRYVDSFEESAPFQVRIGCGRELQFIAKQQIASPVPGIEVGPAADVEHPAQPPEVVDTPLTLPTSTPQPSHEDSVAPELSPPPLSPAPR